MKNIIKKLLREGLRESILKSPFKGRNILYHSTFIDRILKIITGNKIEPKTTQKIVTKFNSDGKAYKGISLTRNVNLVFSDIQLILDGDLIKRDFGKRLVPHDYYSYENKTKDNQNRTTFYENEEFLVGVLEPLSKYLLGIRFTPSSGTTIEEFKMDEPEFYSLFKEKIGNIPFYDNDFNQIKL